MRGETQYWLGDSFLVGGVYEPGVTKARMYLPKKGDPDSPVEGFFNLNAPYQYLDAGQWVDVTSEWQDSIPLLAKVGGGIAVGKGVQTRSTGDNRFPSKNVEEDDYRAVEIFPPRDISEGWASASAYTWYEDDGISRSPQISGYDVHYGIQDSKIWIRFVKHIGSTYVPAWEKNGLHIILPVGDDRPVIAKNPTTVQGHDINIQAVKVGESRGRSVWLNGQIN